MAAGEKVEGHSAGVTWGGVSTELKASSVRLKRASTLKILEKRANCSTEHCELGQLKLENISSHSKLIMLESLDKSVRIWSTETGEVLWTLEQSEIVTSVAFPSDARLIVSGSYLHSIRICSVEDGEVLQTHTGYTDAAHSAVFSDE
ncbi:hypothetical protein HRG_012089 [Hirsutella rhossiliensis]